MLSLLLLSVIWNGALGATGPVHDLRHFEEAILPRWLDFFRAGTGPGDYSFVHGGPIATYGVADVAHVLYMVGLLDDHTGTPSHWCSNLNSLLQEDGWFSLTDEEMAHNHGFQPWHAAGYATAACGLVGCRPARPNAAIRDLATKPSTWPALFGDLLRMTVPCGNKSLDDPNAFCWCAHKIAAIPAVLLIDPPPGGDSLVSWWFDFFDKTVDDSMGFWCVNASQSPPNKGCMDGSFHLHFVYEYVHHTWPHGQQAMATAEHYVDSWQGSLGFGTLDGMYQITRPAAAAGVINDTKVVSFCEYVLSKAETVLNDENNIMTHYAGDTHSLPGALAAVTECIKWFPDRVRTNRPWRQCLDRAPYV